MARHSVFNVVFSLACVCVALSISVSAEETAANKHDAMPENRFALTGPPLDPVASAAVNKGLALDAAGSAVAGGAGIVGSLFAAHANKLGGFLGIHQAVARTVLDIVRAINSLNIAGGQLAVGVADAALSGIVGRIREEAIEIGGVYTELLGEVGRAVGAGVNGLTSLTTGSMAALNPLMIGADALEVHLRGLISFLEGAVDISVASPGRAVAMAPFLGTLRAVEMLLQGLQAAIAGPEGAVGDALDGAIDAATGALGGIAAGGPPGTSGMANLINIALGLVGQLLL